MPTETKPAKDLDKRERIVKRIARELRDGFYVNLGIGLPTQIANYVPAGMDVILQSEKWHAWHRSISDRGLRRRRPHQRRQRNCQRIAGAPRIFPAPILLP